MKHVRDISDPKIGTYIRFRIGSGARESEIVEGQVKEAHTFPDGRVAYWLDNGGLFDFHMGDRIERITQLPPRNRDRTAVKDEEEERKTVKEREHYKRERAALQRERDLLLMIASSLFALLVTYALLRDGSTLLQWALQ